MKKLLLSSLACATLVLAASSEYKYEITPMIGGDFTEGNLNLERNYANGGLAIASNLKDSMFDQVEIGIFRSIQKVKYDNVADGKTSVSRGYANLVKEYSLSTNTSLYALVGIGAEIFGNNDARNQDGLFGNYGAGIKYKISDSVSLKADLRHLVETDHGDNNLLYNFGLAIPFGKVAKAAPVVLAPVVMAPKDSDNDGVIDANDKCPNTVANAVVNAQGCELDSDNDGIVDRLDKCLNTPAGAKVNAQGCELDSDNDGVVDSIDSCPNTPATMKVNEKGCIAKVDLNINFATNSDKITSAYNQKLVDFANMLKNNPRLNATVEAHTDSRGNERYNMNLSKKRALATLKALVNLNVDPSRLKAAGFGSSVPVASNDTKNGRAQNRRVVATINY